MSYKRGNIPWNKGLKGISIGWPKGKKRTIENRKKISIIQTGKKQSKSTIEKRKKTYKKIGLNQKSKNGMWKGGPGNCLDCNIKLTKRNTKRCYNCNCKSISKRNKGIFKVKRVIKKCIYCNKKYKATLKNTKKFCNHKCIINFFQKKNKKRKVYSSWNKGLRGLHIAWNKGKKCSDETIRKIKKARANQIMKPHSIETKKKMRISKSNYIKSIGGHPCIGKYEVQILDEIELSIGYKIIRQHYIIGYYVDGYCKELNLIIEIDENSHKYKKEKDNIREQNIINELNCNFIRIQDTFQKRLI